MDCSFQSTGIFLCANDVGNILTALVSYCMKLCKESFNISSKAKKCGHPKSWIKMHLNVFVLDFLTKDRLFSSSFLYALKCLNLWRRQYILCICSLRYWLILFTFNFFFSFSSWHYITKLYEYTQYHIKFLSCNVYMYLNTPTI